MNRDWLQIAANIALLAGVVLVIIQLRQNTELLELQLLKQDSDSYIAAEMTILGENYSKTWEKMILQPGELTLAEKRQIESFLYGHVLKRWLQLFQLHKRGLISAQEWQNAIVLDGPYELQHPYGIAWWSTIKSYGNMPPKFSNYVDQYIAKKDFNGPRSHYELIDKHLKSNSQNRDDGA